MTDKPMQWVKNLSPLLINAVLLMNIILLIFLRNRYFFADYIFWIPVSDCLIADVFFYQQQEELSKDFFAQNMSKWLKTIWDAWFQKKTDKWIVSQLAQQTAFLKPLRTEEMESWTSSLWSSSKYSHVIFCQWWWSSITTPSLLGQQVFTSFQKK